MLFLFIVNSVVFILCMFLINKELPENKIIQGAEIFRWLLYSFIVHLCGLVFVFQISWKAQMQHCKQIHCDFSFNVAFQDQHASCISDLENSPTSQNGDRFMSLADIVTPHPFWSSALRVCLKRELLRWRSWWNGLLLTESLFSHWSCTMGPGNSVALESLISYTALAISAVKNKIILLISVKKETGNSLSFAKVLGHCLWVFWFVCFIKDSPETLFLVTRLLPLPKYATPNFLWLSLIAE